MPPTRVAFPARASATWMGGHNYLRNLVASLSRYAADTIEPVVFCGEDVPGADLASFTEIDGITVIRHSAFSEDRRTRGVIDAVLTGIDRHAAAAFKAHRIDVLFENARFFGWRIPQPAIAWLPDFQHRRMPELFGTASWWRRDIGFRIQIASGRMALLSSEDARRDCEKYYPKSAGRTSVLHFPAALDQQSMQADPAAVRETYALPDSFIYLPNQFWKHKNHALVAEALGVLQQRGQAPAIVMTGSTSDPRHPGYFGELQQRVQKLGVGDAFRTLGLIPREHVIALLRTCTGFLNPSLFEGWNSGVEEAKSLGVPMLLSDIGVHREQAGKSAAYFPPDDAAALANALLELVAHGAPDLPRKPVIDPESVAREFSGAFADIVRSTLASAPGRVGR